MREATYRDLNQGKLGIFRFNFWWYGEWKEVVVDDRLPVDTNTQELLYAHNTSEPDEFWVCLLEKAYAKLVGCYENLIGASTGFGTVLLTGGVSEYIRFEDVDPAEIFELLSRMQAMNSMFSCAILGPGETTEGKTKEGLFTIHAYCLIKLAKQNTKQNQLKLLVVSMRMLMVMMMMMMTIMMMAMCIIMKYDDNDDEEEEGEEEEEEGGGGGGAMSVQYQGKEVGLVKLRNPWGKKEWNGPWSDSSEEWNGLTEEERKRTNLEVKDDGEFWMDIHDLVKHFSFVDMCHMDPFAITSFEGTEEKTSARKWHTFREDGQWVEKITSGGNDNSKDIYWKNPQYLLEIREGDGDVQTVISLMHRFFREEIKVGTHLYKLKPGYPTPLPEKFDEYATKMETKMKEKKLQDSTFGIFLAPGSYVIVPYNISNESAEFVLRVFTDVAVKIRSLDDVETVNPYHHHHHHLTPPHSKTITFNISHNPLVDLDLSFSHQKSRDGLLTLADTKECWDFVNLCQRHFRACDIDDSGTVDINELLPYYDMSHGKLNKCVAVNICIRYADQKGRMFFDDFCQSLARLRTLTKIYLKHCDDNVTFTSVSIYICTVIINNIIIIIVITIVAIIIIFLIITTTITTLLLLNIIIIIVVVLVLVVVAAVAVVVLVTKWFPYTMNPRST
uniref:Calpain catalytic domain-containing protein n=1 Tax=Octopus bimaculoides TaxID=37653 RepID=A0A0L8H1R2_OCTBM